jgi:hypothetical protein
VLNSYTGANYSRSLVNFNIDERLPDCAKAVPEDAYTFYNSNERCGPLVLANEHSFALTFEPRCAVVVSALENEKALFETFVREGRVLTDDLRVEAVF